MLGLCERCLYMGVYIYRETKSLFANLSNLFTKYKSK